MTTKIKIFDKELCLGIARRNNPNETNEEILLSYLPDEIFGKVFDAAFIKGEYEENWNIVDSDGTDWYVSPAFCDTELNSVFREDLKKKSRRSQWSLWLRENCESDN